jgi:hypothetical protein
MSVEKMADKYRVPSVRYMRYRTDGTRYEGYYSFLPTFNPDGVIAIVGVVTNKCSEELFVTLSDSEWVSSK